MITDILSDHTCHCGCKDPQKFHRVDIREDVGETWWAIRCDVCEGMYALKVAGGDGRICKGGMMKPTGRVRPRRSDSAPTCITCLNYIDYKVYNRQVRLGSCHR
jgi:hypothetical protein